MGRVVGIDFGLKRIGLSLSDQNRVIASALGRVEMKAGILETIQALLLFLAPYKGEIDMIVIGNPLHLNGTVGSMANEVARFKEQLESQVSYKVLLWDERLSSAQAERVLKEGKVNRKKRSNVIDSLAAVIILQSYLDLASNF